MGRGHSRGRGGGRGAPFAASAATEEPAHEEPTGEAGAAQPGRGAGAAQLRGENAVPGGEAPPPPPPSPQLAEVMDRQTRLLEALAEGMLHRQGGQPNDF
jgi:hypothetical protein